MKRPIQVLKFQLKTTSLNLRNVHSCDLDLRSIDEGGPGSSELDDHGLEEGLDHQQPAGSDAPGHRPDGFGERLDVLHVGD